MRKIIITLIAVVFLTCSSLLYAQGEKVELIDSFLPEGFTLEQVDVAPNYRTRTTQTRVYKNLQSFLNSISVYNKKTIYATCRGGKIVLFTVAYVAVIVPYGRDPLYSQYTFRSESGTKKYTRIREVTDGKLEITYFK